MNDKLFWSLLGVILGGWILLFLFMVVPKMNEYDAVTRKLSSEKRAIQKYADMDSSKLPTEDLVEAKEKFLTGWRRQINIAEQFHENRSNLFAVGAISDLSAWATRYRDSFESLQSRYSQHTGHQFDAENKDPPFAIIDDISDPGQVEKYERYWKVQKDLVDRIIPISGASIDGLMIAKKTTRKSSQADSGAFPVVMFAKVPAASVGSLIDGLLSHTYVDFEVKHLAIAKDQSGLIFDVVEEVEDGAAGIGSEPVVLLLLEMDVLEGVVAESSQ